MCIRDSVKIADIEKYYNYKAVTGRLDGKPGGLSCRTLKIHGTLLSLIFKKAIREELIRDNPCQYASCLLYTSTYANTIDYNVYRVLSDFRTDRHMFVGADNNAGLQMASMSVSYTHLIQDVRKC